MSIQRMKLTGAAILVSRGMKVLQAAPAAYPYRSALIAWGSLGVPLWRKLPLALMPRTSVSWLKNLLVSWGFTFIPITAL